MPRPAIGRARRRRYSRSAGRRRSPRRSRRPPAPAASRCRGRSATSAPAEAGMDEPLGEEADAELDAEVDAEPDEQRDEGDRDQVEAAGRQQPERGRHDQAQKRGQQDRRHHAAGMHGPPQDPQQRKHHGRGDQVPILRPAIANSSSASGTGPVRRMRTPCGVVEGERAGRRADRVARRLTGLQRAEVHHRLDDEDAPRLAPDIRRRHEVLPGEEGRLTCRRLVEGVGERRQRGWNVIELRLAVLDALQQARNGGEHAAQAGSAASDAIRPCERDRPSTVA